MEADYTFGKTRGLILHINRILYIIKQLPRGLHQYLMIKIDINLL